MGEQRVTVWTCDRCALRIEMPGTDSPARWERCRLTGIRSNAGELFLTLCGPCAASFREWYSEGVV